MLREHYLPPHPQQPTESNNSILNLSKHFVLTHHQSTLLRKGLSFVPTTTASQTAHQHLAVDLRTYHRRLKLHSYFGPNTFPYKKTFSTSSEWEPHVSLLPTPLLELLSSDGQQISNLQYSPDTPNLPPAEAQALSKLIRTRGLVIKPADKGSAVVLMDLVDYVSEVLRQLKDTEYYIPLTEPMYMETATIIQLELTSLHKSGILTKKQLTYLLGQSPPCPRYFYLLPKIHKPMTKWTVPHRIPPGCPIVSDCVSESYGVAEYLDHFLTPLSIKHASYV